ncbi:DUF4236 domain-containing protein [Fictibacillus sp. KU28468]|uniref:DUF4236 domain-containing protein n=1 Tax=Fictibacillus sp. KU28468 TaxID=2991053 RepID=UPI0039F72925
MPPSILLLCHLSYNILGISAGTKGLRVSHGADGKTRVTASIPGTGLSYQETIQPKKEPKVSRTKNRSHNPSDLLYQFEGLCPSGACCSNSESR